VIDLVGTRADALSFADHQLVVTEGGRTIAGLHFAGHYTTGGFSPSPDGVALLDLPLRFKARSQAMLPAVLSVKTRGSPLATAAVNSAMPLLWRPHVGRSRSPQLSLSPSGLRGR
jgi:hypothetical protein